MRNKVVQLSLFDTYTDVLETMEENKSELVLRRSYRLGFSTHITTDTVVSAPTLWKVSFVL